MPGIIDFHAHAFPDEIAEKAVKQIGKHYSLVMNGKGTIGDLLDSAQRASIDYIVFHSTATKPSQVRSINDWITDNSIGKLIGFGTLHPDYMAIEEEIDRIISLGLKGIKVHPDFQGFNADDPKMDRIYEGIGSKLPVLLHVGDEHLDYASPARIAHVIERFPSLKVIAAHLGGHKKWEEAKVHLIGKDLFLDTSSALMFMEPDYAVNLIRAHGTDRVLFGTDYPITYHDEELRYFNKLDLTKKERSDILYHNAAKLLGLPCL